MFRFLASMLVLCSFFAACGDPCYNANGDRTCTGLADVDLTTDPPTFTLNGAGDVTPDRLEVAHWEDGSPCEGGGTMTVWELENLPGGKVVYGEVPQGAREVVPDEPLVDGDTYSVYFWLSEGWPSRSASTHEDWVGVFVAGDPESGMSEGEFCGASGG